MELLLRLAELFGTAIAASWITRILTIRARVRQEKADADKAETEVKADQIDNIERLVEKVYKPTIETLEKQVKELRWEVAQVRQENARVIAENDELKTQNKQYRMVILELRPDLITEKPSRRGENAKSQPRNPDGTFAKEL
jgi:predicted RNase H-like nuclease (RuvC/YqgF family)